MAKQTTHTVVVPADVFMLPAGAEVVSVDVDAKTQALTLKVKGVETGLVATVHRFIRESQPGQRIVYKTAK